MRIEEAKLTIVQKILAVENTSIIEKINKILDKEMIVGYTVDGKPLTKAAFNKRLAAAEKQIESGNFISQEGLEKESENW